MINLLGYNLLELFGIIHLIIYSGILLYVFYFTLYFLNEKLLREHGYGLFKRYKDDEKYISIVLNYYYLTIGYDYGYVILITKFYENHKYGDCVTVHEDGKILYYSILGDIGDDDYLKKSISLKELFKL